ncbi:MAG: DUF3782 domain-containing protein [Methanobacteriota archaeon]
MSNIAEVIRHFPGDLQDPILQFWEVMKDEIGVKREDFSELKSIVLDLAEAQNRTEHRVEELAQAQNRTEHRVEELAVAQKELAEAQKELTQAQRDTERSLQRLSNNMDFKLGGMGRRWGLGSESSFRKGLAEILSETGYEVFNYVESDTEGVVFGRPAEIEIDVIIKGGKTIIVEIKSSVSKSDVFVFMKKADFYEHSSGSRIDRLFIITPFIDDPARVVANQYDIVICDSISDLGSTIQRV